MNVEELLEFLKEQIPLKYDMRMENIRYDYRNPYYKIYKLITSQKETIEKSIEWVTNNIYYSDEQNEFTQEANPDELLTILREEK